MIHHSEKSILVVGSLAFDDLEMPTGTFKDVIGGAATYSAIASSLLAPVRLVGVVGADFPQAMLDDLGKRGVDTKGVERQAGKTFRWHGRYSSDLASRETLDTQLNVFADFRPKIPKEFAASPLVMLGNIHPALQLEVLKQVERPQLVVADTMNFWIQGEPKTLAELLPKVDVLVINDEEVRELAGVHNLRRAAEEVRRRGPKALIVKRGEHGALLFDAQGVFFVPAYPLEEVCDPTGAGDSFAGGLLGYLASHDHTEPHALRRAMFFASAMGSFCVEGIGPRRLLSITKRDLRSRLDQFLAMVEYGGDLPFRE
ncbi:MAG: sugar kinase [Myxococcales bacterium]|jgi:sugar/nucleoside kinase (ribokinase family)|nr:sugar kinase [Myxococcales bacterium]